MLEKQYSLLLKSRKRLERRIAEEEKFVPKDTKRIDELNLKLEEVMRDTRQVKAQHDFLNNLGLKNRVKARNEIIRQKELDKLRKEGVNVVRV